MNYSKWILGAGLLFSSQFAFVQGGGYDGHCDPCDPCYHNPCDICDIDFCDVEFDFYVDALYWEVCKSDHQAFLTDEDTKVKYLDPGYQWGYRIGANAGWKCWDLGLRYTSICFDDSKSIPLSEGEKVKTKLDFDVLDVELGYTCCLDCGLVFRPFLGAKLAWVDDKLERTSDILLGAFEESKIDYNGYGLYAGTSMRWELTSFCACERDIPVALVARASTGVLRSSFDEDIEGDGNGIESRDRCNYIPVHELYAGLDFTFCDLCGWDAFFQVGYETQYWGWVEYNDNDDTAHIGMGGLVLRFGASF